MLHVGFGAVSIAILPHHCKTGSDVGSGEAVRRPLNTYTQLDSLLRVAHIGSDVVDAILYLESASFVTGAILHVEGGQSAGH